MCNLQNSNRNEKPCERVVQRREQIYCAAQLCRIHSRYCLITLHPLKHKMHLNRFSGSGFSHAEPVQLPLKSTSYSQPRSKQLYNSSDKIFRNKIRNSRNEKFRPILCTRCYITDKTRTARGQTGQQCNSKS